MFILLVIEDFFYIIPSSQSVVMLPGEFVV